MGANGSRLRVEGAEGGVKIFVVVEQKALGLDRRRRIVARLEFIVDGQAQCVFPCLLGDPAVDLDG